MNENNKIQYGWICPKCGAVMSPKQPTCVFCVPTSICYSINNIPYMDIDYSKRISQTAKSISQTESYYNGRLGDKEGKQ